MEWAFTWSFWLNVAAGAIGLTLAIIVLRQGLPARISLPLVTLMILEAVQFLGDSVAWLAHFDDIRVGRAALQVALACGLMLAPAYLVFLMFVVPGSATAPLRTRVGRFLVWAYSALIAINVLMFIAWDTLMPIQLLVLVPFVWAIVAGVHAVIRSAPGTAERRSGLALLLAFGSRDILWLALNTGLFAGYEYLPGDVIRPVHLEQIPADYIVIGLVALLYFPAIVYAVLSGRIVDIDQRFQTGVAQAVSGAFVAIIFVTVTEVLELIIDTQSQAISVMLAVALAFLFKPIQDAATSLTRLVFPSHDDRAERLAFYTRQYRLAAEDGVITPKERRMLDDVAKQLRLRAADIQAAEDNV